MADVTDAEREEARKIDLPIDQYLSIKHVFRKFDVDASDYLDLEELGTLAAELGDPLDDEELLVAMRNLDTNNNGKISFSEFIAWWAEEEE
mmetsp:Transcript_1963/g.5463  ORF Transcript_1963/g.5463 Transcript_1963/m.5463 type:complete len:91 (+) Transcript_1963:68-340(+)